MINQEYLVKHIDDLRQKKGFTIHAFTEGIISERTYRRYVNDNKAFTFEVLIKLVHKLNMRMRDVLMYAFNQISSAHYQEIYFAHYMTLREHTMAAPYYDVIKDKELQTHLGTIYIPVLLHYYQYPKDYLKFAKARIGFDTLFNQTILNRQTLDVLIFILDDVTEIESQMIVTYLLKFLKGEIKLISFKHAIDTSNTLQKVINYVTKTKERLLNFQDDIKALLNMGLEDIKQEHVISNYELFLESIINYATHTENHTLRDRFIYYDVANHQTLLDRPITRNHLYSKEDGITRYQEQLQTLPLLFKEQL